MTVTPVTAEDWLFAHEVIGHAEYEGPRYDSTLKNVVGMEEYHDGKADTISGISSTVMVFFIPTTFFKVES